MINVSDRVAKAYRVGVSPFEVQAPMLGAEWADKHLYLSPESSGTEGRWKCYPYQIAIINWMTSDDIEEVNWMKSRRVGYTKCLLAAVGYKIHQQRRNVAIWQPTDGDAKEFVTDEVETMIRDVPVIGAMLRCAVGAKSKFNTVDKKVFNGATLDIKGGKSARNYRRMTKDVAIYDETDGFDRDIDGEGSCFELGDGRLDQAPFPKSIRGSTPKTKGKSLIETAVKNSDMIFYRFVPCPHCGELQRLEFSGLKWDDGKPDSVRYLCKNGCEIFYRDYPAMDIAGRWQTIDGYYYSDQHDRFYAPDNSPIHKPRRIGARIWAGYSYLRPWSYVVDKWIVASREAKAGNVIALKSIVNTLLGETWEDRTTLVEPTKDNVLDCKCDLPPQVVPESAVALTCGIDVQKDGFWYSVRAWANDYTSWNVAHGYLSSWSDLEHLLFEAQFPIQNNKNTMRIWRACIDTGGGKYTDISSTEETYLWLQDNSGSIGGCRVWGVKGSSNQLPTKIKLGAVLNRTPSGRSLKLGMRLILADTNKAKDLFHSRMERARSGLVGGAWLHKETDINYASQITAEHKQDDGKGNEKWVQIGRRDNHLLDCEYMSCLLADWEWPGGGVNLLTEPVNVVHEKQEQHNKKEPVNPFTGGHSLFGGAI